MRFWGFKWVSLGYLGDPYGCPRQPSTGENFRPKAPCLPPAHGHGSRPLPVSSTITPSEEAWRIPKHHLGTVTSTSRPLWPHHQGDTRLAVLTKKEKLLPNHSQAMPRPRLPQQATAGWRQPWPRPGVFSDRRCRIVGVPFR
jgi:hypothetical protein